MEGFTFVVLTYNQAQYILDHLESVRLQIERWGEGREVHLVVSDDHSSDETVFLAENWVHEHSGLFARVQVLKNEQNQGIVKNYLQAVRCVDTSFFKVLAADDLYYKNDVFDAAQTGNFVLSPPLYFQDGRVLQGQYSLRHWVFQEFVHHQGKGLKRQLLKRQKYNNCIYTPGVFYQKELLDARAETALKGHRWMEDYPLWNCFLKREDVEPEVVCEPLVLYRVSSGISTRASHEKHIAYEQEYLAFLRKISSPFAKYPLCINPYRYFYYARYFLKGLFYFFVVRWKDKQVDEFMRRMQTEERQANKYLEEIRKRGNCQREA